MNINCLSNWIDGWINFNRSKSLSRIMAGTGLSSSRICFNSPRTLRPLRPSKKFMLTAFSISPLVNLPIVKPKRCSKRMARNTRVGSSTKLKLCSTRMIFSLISLRAEKKSINVPNFSLFSWIASVLMVKSRRKRSSLMELISTIGSAAGNL